MGQLRQIYLRMDYRKSPLHNLVDGFYLHIKDKR